MNSVAVSLPEGTFQLSFERSDGPRPLLLLHGGAGPTSMHPLLKVIEGSGLILPTHPGFDATERPEWMRSISDLARSYLALIEKFDLRDVVIIGNSVGGWIAAEMAASYPERLAGIILINAVGIQPTQRTGPIVDPRSVPPTDLTKLAFADPSKAPLVRSDLAEIRRTNQQVLMTYAGDPFMHDPTLTERLALISLPTLVLWGQADGVVSAEYGREYARQIATACFRLIENAGHFPQIEQPEKTAEAILGFVAELVAADTLGSARSRQMDGGT